MIRNLAWGLLSALWVAGLISVVVLVLFVLSGDARQQVLPVALVAATLAATPASVEVLRLVRSGLKLVQLGLDVAFDILYCAGLIVLGATLYRHPAFGRVIGARGVGCGIALLTTNMLAFPYVPADAGLVDLGPLTGVWWLVLIAKQARRWRRRPPTLASA